MYSAISRSTHRARNENSHGAETCGVRILRYDTAAEIESEAILESHTRNCQATRFDLMPRATANSYVCYAAFNS